MRLMERVAILFGGDREYPQTWALWSVWGRRTGLYRIGQWWCGRSGHEWSKTEWGYGGGAMMDRWCRWCNAMGRVPVAEHELDERQRRLMGKVGTTVDEPLDEDQP